MKRLLPILFFIGLFSNSYSQNFIKGSVKDSTQNPVPFCAMALLNAKDSILVKGNVSDSVGNFIFEKIKPGNYFVKFNNVGYKVLASPVFSIDSLGQIELPTQILSSVGVNLKEISVSVIKPTIEFKKGMTVMNVENNIFTAGNTVFELLKRIPGVTVDAQNNIAINGKGGVRFLFDGRLQQIPSGQLVNLLMGMPAESVSNIEIITNPPARYDASGAGGLINIVFKKAKVKGFSGSIAQSVSKGDNWRGGSFLTLNFKSNKFTFYSNTNLSYLHFKTDNYFQRKITDSTGTFEIISQGNQQPHRNILFFNAGAEYEISQKTVIGVNVNGSGSRGTTIEKTNINLISHNDPASNSVAFDHIYFQNETRSNVNNPTYNLNLSHKFDSVTNLVFSTDYTNYTEALSRFNESHYYDINNTEISAVNRFGSKTGLNFNVFTQKLDFDKQLKKGFRLETGAKSSFVDNYAKSDVYLTDFSTNTLYRDSAYSNNYNYKERVLAAYVTMGKEWKKLDVSVGIRTEHTLVNATNAPKPFTLHRDYINFFPSGSVDYKLNDKNSIQANYSYRISRPSYDQMNPSRNFNDPFSNGAGNPYLKPQFTHSMGMNYNFARILNLHVSYDVMHDNIYFYAYGNPNTKATIDSVFNYKQQNFTHIDFSFQKQWKWININFFTWFNYRDNSTIVNNISIRNYSTQGGVYCATDFILPKDIKFQVMANYNSFNFDGIQTYYPNGRIDLVLFKSFFNKKLDISISLFDALYTDIQPWKNRVGGQYSYYTERNDTRRFRLWIMWRFGKMRINQNLKRSNDEEKGRLKSVN
jgi:iron complex outermembrane receptor protein